ncbi:MAG: hypothetical protein GC129_07100 [Proteobacteria bacterium]|nr:hypothetical protein [Pseudomonadota bacterium]
MRWIINCALIGGLLLNAATLGPLAYGVAMLVVSIADAQAQESPDEPMLQVWSQSQRAWVLIPLSQFLALREQPRSTGEDPPPFFYGDASYGYGYTEEPEVYPYQEGPTPFFYGNQGYRPNGRARGGRPPFNNGAAAAPPPQVQQPGGQGGGNRRHNRPALQPPTGQDRWGQQVWTPRPPTHNGGGGSRPPARNNGGGGGRHHHH